MAFNFRYATIDDIESISAIELASMNNPWKADAYQEAISSDHAFVMVAEQDGKIAGFAVFYLTPPESELPDIVVSQEYRSHGLGRMLLTHCFDELRTKSIETIFLEVRVSNTPARTLYEHLGFESIGTRKYFYSNPTEDALCMRIEI